jgi:hypothetical protein
MFVVLVILFIREKSRKVLEPTTQIEKIQATMKINKEAREQLVGFWLLLIIVTDVSPEAVRKDVSDHGPPLDV